MTAMQEMLEWVRATMPMDLDAVLLIGQLMQNYTTTKHIYTQPNYE